MVVRMNSGLYVCGAALVHEYVCDMDGGENADNRIRDDGMASLASNLHHVKALSSLNATST